MDWGVEHPQVGLTVGLLGPLLVCVAGLEVPVAGPKRRELLARLSIDAGRAVSTDRLIEDLWGASPPPGARATLQSHVSHLRRDLGVHGSALRHSPAGYVLDISPEAVDALRFERLAHTAMTLADPLAAADGLCTALALWRDQALAEFAGQPWARDDAARLDELRLLATSARIDADLRLGRHAALVGELEALVAERAWNERSWLQLMTALDGSGRQVEAVQVGQRLRAGLAELGMDPSPALAELEGRILRHETAATDPTVRARPVHSSETWAEDALPGPTRQDELPFVGRRAELDAVAGAVAAAERGACRVVLIAGEPGIGKTRLAVEAARAARATGALVLAGRCDDELLVPFQPFVEAIRQWWEDVPQESRGAHPSWTAELRRLVPELDVDPPPAGIEPRGGADPAFEQYRLFEAVCDWVAAASRDAPVVLVVDDLHWATRSTLLLLRHVVRSPRARRLCVVGTYRDTEPDAATGLVEITADLRRAVQVVDVAVGGLSERAVHELVAKQHLGPVTPLRDRDVRELWSATSGNPLFIGEVLHHLTDRSAAGDDGIVLGQLSATTPVPRGVAEIVAARIGRLAGPTIRVLEQASVLGADFDLRNLESMAGLGEASLAEAIGHAQRARIVEQVDVGGRRYRFCHAIVHEAVYQSLTGRRRALLHRDALASLTGHPAETGDRHLALLAHHAVRAAGVVDGGTVVHHCHAAGDHAMVGRAFDAAATHFRAGLDALDAVPSADPTLRCELLLRLGEAERRLPEADHRSTFLVAADLARRLQDPERLARAGKGISRSFRALAGSTDLARMQVLRAALELCGEHLPSQRARLLASLAGEQRLAGEEGEAAERMAEAVELARRAADGPTLLRVLATQWDLLFHPATLHVRTALVAELEAEATDQDDPYYAWQASVLGACMALERGDAPGLVARLVDSHDRAEAAGDPSTTWVMPMVDGTAALARGQLDLAESLVLRAATTGATMGAEGLDAAVAAALFEIRSLQGRLVELDPVLGTIQVELPAARAVHARVCLEAGRASEARAIFEDLLTGTPEPIPRDVTWPLGIAVLAELSALLGDAAGAACLEPLVDGLESRMLAWASYFVGPVAHVRGLLRLAQGDLDGADGWFERAAADADTFGAPAHLARTRLVQCGLRRRAGGSDLRRFAMSAAAEARRDGLPQLAERLEAQA